MPPTFMAGLGAVSVLALCTVSLVLFGWQMIGGEVIAFVRDNTVPHTERTALLKSMIGSGALVGAVALSYARINRFTGLTTLGRLARLASPFLLACAVPPLFVQPVWEPLTAALAFGAFVLILEQLLRVSLGALEEMTGASALPYRESGDRRIRRLCTVIVFAAAAYYAFHMSRYTLYNHRAFRTYNFDLGQYDNVFFNALHGHPLRCTPLGAMTDWSSLSGHADLGIYFFLPIYAIWPRAETLLVIQAVMLGLGAVPLYFFAVRRLPPPAACLLAVCYLLFPPLHGANFYDFHFQPIAATLILFIIWFMDARRWVLCALFFMIALSCREDISIGLTMLGLYLAVSGYRPRAGIVMALAGATYFVVIRYFVMSKFGPGWFADMYKDLYPRPTGPNTYSGIMQTLVTNPIYVFRTLLTAEKLRYFLQITVPIAFLPLRRAYLLPALAPGSLFTLLTTQYGPTTDIGFQYSGHFTPYLFAASAVGLASYRWDSQPTVKFRAATAALFTGTLLCTSHWGAIPAGGPVKGGFGMVNFSRPTEADANRARDLAELAALVPFEAKVATSEEELPHLSNRLNIVGLRDGVQEAEYILYGLNGTGAPAAAKAVEDGDYVEIAKRGSAALLKRR